MKERPCKNGCRFADDCGMKESACANGCMYDRQADELQSLADERGAELILIRLALSSVLRDATTGTNWRGMIENIKRELEERKKDKARLDWVERFASVSLQAAGVSVAGRDIRESIDKAMGAK